MKALKANVENQVYGPLYNEEDAAHYRNLNDAPVSPNKGDEEENDLPATDAALEMPDYQDIAKSVE